MNAVPMIFLRVTGAIAILCSAFGLYYNVSSLTVAISGDFSSGGLLNDAPHFYPAFYTMSGICIICYVLLTVFGIQFFRGNPARALGFTFLIVFEIAYFLLLSLTWLVPDFGMSVAAATGVANGGLMAQFLILFPLWAPPIALWNRKRFRDLAEQNQAELGPHD